MKMGEYIRELEAYVASRKLNLGDGESVLSLLYEAYGDINPMYDDQIKATPHNSARKLSERFCASSKFQKRGNTVCISRFWNCRNGAKDPLRSADAIVRCCLKTDFAELYHALNGTPLQEMGWIINPVCTLCRDHERSGFVHGVQVGIRLAQETRIAE